MCIRIYISMFMYYEHVYIYEFICIYMHLCVYLHLDFFQNRKLTEVKSSPNPLFPAEVKYRLPSATASSTACAITPSRKAGLDRQKTGNSTMRVRRRNYADESLGKSSCSTQIGAMASCSTEETNKKCARSKRRTLDKLYTGVQMEGEGLKIQLLPSPGLVLE